MVSFDGEDELDYGVSRCVFSIGIAMPFMPTAAVQRMVFEYSMHDNYIPQINPASGINPLVLQVCRLARFHKRFLDAYFMPSFITLPSTFVHLTSTLDGAVGSSSIHELKLNSLGVKCPSSSLTTASPTQDLEHPAETRLQDGPRTW